LLVSAYLFKQEALTATTHTLFWCVSFFFASAGASSAYLGSVPKFVISVQYTLQYFASQIFYAYN
jgi:hypothetical protein